MRNFLPKALVLFSGMIGSAFAQQKPVDLQNCRHGESVEYCTQHKLHEEMMKDPQFAADFKRSGHMLDSIVNEIVMQRQKDKNNGIKPKATVYRIPVVFHVLHDNGPENISRDQILDCIRVWNLDWRGRNPDTANVRAEFKPIIADMEIEFVLATKAPNGAVFSGITRTVSNKTDAAASG